MCRVGSSFFAFTVLAPSRLHLPGAPMGFTMLLVLSNDYQGALLAVGGCLGCYDSSQRGGGGVSGW